MNNFRKSHLLQILRQFAHQSKPLDVFLNSYYRLHKAIGSKDRQEISTLIYEIIRIQSLLDYICPDPLWEKKLNCFLNPSFNEICKNQNIPDPIKACLPLTLYQKLVEQYGKQKTEALAQICQTNAPITIRTNAIKTTRKELFDRLSSQFEMTLCAHSQLGIQFHKRINFNELEEFQQGLFEVQDEASQLVSFLVKAQAKDKVLDFCAGAGGKTLGFAPFMNNKGLIYLHDVRKTALMQAKKRLSRASIFNVQYLTDLSTFKEKMDWILVDAPCSGTGTYRRNVDLKWKFSDEMLKELIEKQRQIFSQAIKYLKKDGKIIYATCSILKEENENQIEHFLKQHNLSLVESPFSTIPLMNGMDGFFAATMKPC